MATDCTVWQMFQARCTLCGWSGETYAPGDRNGAAYDAREHRKSPEHRRKLRERREAQPK